MASVKGRICAVPLHWSIYCHTSYITPLLHHMSIYDCHTLGILPGQDFPGDVYVPPRLQDVKIIVRDKS